MKRTFSQTLVSQWYAPILKIRTMTFVPLKHYNFVSFVLPWHCDFANLHPPLHAWWQREAISVMEVWRVVPWVLSDCHPWAVTSLWTPPPWKIFTDTLDFNSKIPCISYYTLYCSFIFNLISPSIQSECLHSTFLASNKLGQTHLPPPPMSTPPHSRSVAKSFNSISHLLPIITPQKHMRIRFNLKASHAAKTNDIVFKHIHI